MARAVEGEGLVPTPYVVRGVWTDFSRGRASKIRYLPDRAGDVTAELTRRMARLSRWRLLEPFAQENYQVMNYGPGGLISVHMDDTTLGYQQEDFDQAQSLIDWGMGTIRQSPALSCLIYSWRVAVYLDMVTPQVFTIKTSSKEVFCFFHIGEDECDDQSQAIRLS